MSLACPPVGTNSSGFPKASVSGVNLGTEAATRTTQSLVLGRAMGRARRAGMGAVYRRVDKNICKSGRCTQPACAASSTPCAHQRENRLNTEFQRPSDSGSNRHCVPPRRIHSTATKKDRHCSSQPIRTFCMSRQNRVNHFPLRVADFQSMGHVKKRELSPPEWANVNRT